MTFAYFTSCCAAVFALLVLTKALNQWRQSGRFPIYFGKTGTLKERFEEVFAVSGLFATLVCMTLSPWLGLTGLFFDSISFLNSVAIGLLGGVLASLSILVLAKAYVDMGESWRLGIDRETADKLVTTGIFAKSRNPICIAINLLLVGYFLANPNLFFLILAVVGLLGTHTQILNEERFLAAHYGEEFASFAARTGRYWTFN